LRSVEPADAYTISEANRVTELNAADERFEQQGGKDAVDAAGHWLQLFRTLHVSQGNQQSIISGVHAINDAGLLVKPCGKPMEVNLPRKLITLQTRGGGTRVLDEDVPLIRTFFCMQSMRQTAQTCSVVRSDVSVIIQSILLDIDSRPGVFLVEGPMDRRREYCDEHGNSLRGTEPYHGSRWDVLRSTVPADGKLLAVVVTSDSVESQRKDRHPIAMSLANIPNGDGSGERRIRCFGMTGVVQTRKARGSKVSESLAWDQKAYKKNLYTRMFAELLVDFQELAKHGAFFWVRMQDGSLQRIKLYPRLFAWQADMEEQHDCSGIGTKLCHRCFAYADVTKDGAGCAGTPNRPHMSTSACGFCPTATRRTALSTARRQQVAMMALRAKTLKEALKVASELGVNPLVEGCLYRLNCFIVHAAGSVFGVDVLHTWRTGILHKLAFIIDAAMHMYFTKSLTFKNSEDVRHEVDTRLALIPHKYGSPSFSEGFWASNDIGSIKGEEVTFLLELLCFVIVADDLLIGNVNVRKQLLKLAYNALSFVNEAYTPQWYTEEEDKNMSTRVDELFGSMHTVMDLLTLPGGGYSPLIKCGMDAPKVHAAGFTAEAAKRYGCNANVDTEAGERGQKNLKYSDKFTDHNVVESNGPLTQRLVARQQDAARSEQLKKATKYRAVQSANSSFALHSTSRNTLGNALFFFSSSSSTFFFLLNPLKIINLSVCLCNKCVGEGYKWECLVENLGMSAAGPLVSLETIIQCTSQRTLSQINGFRQIHNDGQGGGSASAAAAVAAVECEHFNAADVQFYSEVSVPCKDAKVSSFIFTAGHTVETTQGTFVQILVPAVVSKASYDSGAFRANEAQCIVSEFIPVRPAKPMHPELDVPWIRRGDVKVLSVSDLVKRVHVPPVFGNAHRRQTDGAVPHFLVNTLGDPFYAGPRERLVFQRCRNGTCVGLLPKPLLPGSMVSCNVCRRACQWF
jgi:hypothetical protein